MGVIMKKLNINQFDTKEEEIAEALMSLGLGRAVARTLAFLTHRKLTMNQMIHR